MKTNILTSLLLIIVSSFSSFTKPDALRFHVDTKLSSLQWTASKVTGFHTGTAPIQAGELVTDGKTIKQGSFEIDLASLTVTDITDDIRFRSSSFFENLGDKAIADEFELDLKLVANLHTGV